MKRFMIKLLLVIYVLFLLLSGPFSLSVAPADLPLFVAMFCIAVIGLILGLRESKRWRVVWISALLISMLGATLEVVVGKRIARQRLEHKKTRSGS
ncbi:MAG: hypothetical protein C5B50_00245 [Verrucomicrobia bacterium]|nr:MAG: hypothetical protein C5B50_00245 [Verrucomicrobiota bacterium]